MLDNIHYASLLDVSHLIRRREISAKKVCEALLSRIERLEGQLHTFIRVMSQSALEQAETADREIAAGLWRGPLHGIPIGIKDLLDMAGVPTTCGTEVLKDYVPDKDATVVGRLRRAGAVLIGKVHMTEAATLSHHPIYPRPDNPWRKGYWTGVSSSGSGVATAAGLCYGALGTDTGGSIRLPSGACGLAGIKPTWGRVSRHGLFPLAASFDHIGPMARSAADAAAILQAIAGEDADDPTALPGPVPDYLGSLEGGINGLSIGIDRALAETNVDPLVSSNFEQTLSLLKMLGARIREIKLPSFPALMAQVRPLLTAEVMVAHEATYPSQAEKYGPDLKNMLDSGAPLTAMDIAKAVQSRAAFAGELRKIFKDVDLILMPAAPAPTPSWDEMEAMSSDMAVMMDRVARYTMPFNVSGSPTLSLPSGFTPSGLPIGIQLIGPHLSEALLCRAGYAFQQATDFHTLHPTLQ